jgi:hypothetical protein
MTYMEKFMESTKVFMKKGNVYECEGNFRSKCNRIKEMQIFTMPMVIVLNVDVMLPKMTPYNENNFLTDTFMEIDLKMGKQVWFANEGNMPQKWPCQRKEVLVIKNCRGKFGITLIASSMMLRGLPPLRQICHSSGDLSERKSW